MTEIAIWWIMPAKPLSDRQEPIFELALNDTVEPTLDMSKTDKEDPRRQ